MGLFNFLFGKKNTDYTDYALSESCQSVVKNANAFAGFCRKIGRDESYHFPIYYYVVKTDSTEDIGVFATHISDSICMESAYRYAKEGDVHFVELVQKGMAKTYDLTPTELSVLQDAERFTDSLLSRIPFEDFLFGRVSFADFFSGGISRVISCRRDGSTFEITRFLGNVPVYEKKIILSEIKMSLLSSYSDVKIEKDIDTKNPISFSVKF